MLLWWEQYLANVSSSTVDWYKNSLKRLPSESPSQQELKDTLMQMCEKGLKRADPYHIVVWVVAKLLLPHNAAIMCLRTLTRPRSSLPSPPESGRRAAFAIQVVPGLMLRAASCSCSFRTGSLIFARITASAASSRPSLLARLPLRECGATGRVAGLSMTEGG
jgi:hypothetical protein